MVKSVSGARLERGFALETVAESNVTLVSPEDDDCKTVLDRRR